MHCVADPDLGVKPLLAPRQAVGVGNKEVREALKALEGGGRG